MPVTWTLLGCYDKMRVKFTGSLGYKYMKMEVKFLSYEFGEC